MNELSSKLELLVAAISLGLKKFWAVLFLALSASIFLSTVAMPSSNKTTHGFAAYYTSSRLVLEYRGGPIFYEDRAFQAEVYKVTQGQVNDIYWANPPTTSVIFMPLAMFSITSARYAWTVISLIALLIAILLLGRLFFQKPFQSNAFCLTSSILLLSAPLAANFQYGQVYVLILALYAIALFALSHNLDWASGFPLGLILALKASGLPLLVLMVLRGKWRLAIWTLLTFMAMALLSIPLVGSSAWRTYLFDALPNFLADPALAVTAYQTIPGFFRHLFTYDSLWNPGPAADWPKAASLISVLVTFTLLGLATMNARRNTVEWMFIVGLILSAILVPAAEQHHYLLLVPAFFFAVRYSTIPKAPLYLAAILIAAPFSYTEETLSAGWLSLLAYPRLYGALLLFTLLQYHRISPQQHEPKTLDTHAFSRNQ